MVQNFNVQLKEMEVRKVEEVSFEIDDKTYRSLLVHFDTEEGDRLVFKDKIVDNKEHYKRGDIGTLTINIATENKIKEGKIGPYVVEQTNMKIQDWKPKRR